MELTELIESAGDFVALGAALAVVLLLPLYFSQRRDIARLTDWMEREPDHPRHDLTASIEILDRAETELEELVSEPAPVGDTVVQPPGPGTPVPAGRLSPAERVIGERPALERITMERAALEPHPRWRRFTARVTQPRALAAIAAIAVVVGLAAIFGSERLLSGDGDGTAGGGSFDPSEVTVTVLNGTSEGGLAGKVASDVEAAGFGIGDVTNTDPGFEATVVMFQRGEERPARKVARELGISEAEPIDRSARALAGDADVVVIAGEDRAR